RDGASRHSRSYRVDRRVRSLQGMPSVDADLFVRSLMDEVKCLREVPCSYASFAALASLCPSGSPCSPVQHRPGVRGGYGNWEHKGGGARRSGKRYKATTRAIRARRECV